MLIPLSDSGRVVDISPNSLGTLDEDVGKSVGEGMADRDSDIKGGSLGGSSGEGEAAFGLCGLRAGRGGGDRAVSGENVRALANDAPSLSAGDARAEGDLREEKLLTLAAIEKVGISGLSDAVRARRGGGESPPAS